MSANLMVRIILCTIILNYSSLISNNYIADFDHISFKVWTDLDLMLAIDLEPEQKIEFLTKTFFDINDLYKVIKKLYTNQIIHNNEALDYIKERINFIRKSFDLAFNSISKNNNLIYKKINKIFYKLEMTYLVTPAGNKI